MDKSDFAGIEVSQDELLVALRREEQTLPLQSFPNTGEGHRALGRYLARKGRVVRACMESTGVYGLDLALLLQKRPGVEVMVANPRAVRHFAQALMQRSKTDPLDAMVLLEFAARLPFQSWQPPSPTALHRSARRREEPPARRQRRRSPPRRRASGHRAQHRVSRTRPAEACAAGPPNH